MIAYESISRTGDATSANVLVKKKKKIKLVTERNLLALILYEIRVLGTASGPRSRDSLGLTE